MSVQIHIDSDGSADSLTNRSLTYVSTNKAVLTGFHATSFSHASKSRILANPLKSENQFYNKQRAHLQGLLPENQHASHRLTAITTKRTRRVNAYLPHH